MFVRECVCECAFIMSEDVGPFVCVCVCLCVCLCESAGTTQGCEHAEVGS